METKQWRLSDQHWKAGWFCQIILYCAGANSMLEVRLISQRRTMIQLSLEPPDWNCAFQVAKTHSTIPTKWIGLQVWEVRVSSCPCSDPQRATIQARISGSWQFPTPSEFVEVFYSLSQYEEENLESAFFFLLVSRERKKAKWQYLKNYFSSSQRRCRSSFEWGCFL